MRCHERARACALLAASVVFAALLLWRLDPKREPVFRHAALMAASPHIRSSFAGSDHNRAVATFKLCADRMAPAVGRPPPGHRRALENRAGKPLERPGAVGQGERTARRESMLFLRGHFAERSRMAVGPEDRVVTEAFGAARREDELAVDPALEGFDPSVR